MARSLDRGWRIVWLALVWPGGVAWQRQQAALSAPWAPWAPMVSALMGLAALGLAGGALLLCRCSRRRSNARPKRVSSSSLPISARALRPWRARVRI
jgi:hypothetical protein